MPALAQDRAASAPMAGMAASMPQDCGKTTMKPHNHGADRYTGIRAAKAGTDAPCGPAAAASAAEQVSKKKPAHDHTKVHKTQ